MTVETGSIRLLLFDNSPLKNPNPNTHHYPATNAYLSETSSLPAKPSNQHRYFNPQQCAQSISGRSTHHHSSQSSPHYCRPNTKLQFQQTLWAGDFVLDTVEIFASTIATCLDFIGEALAVRRYPNSRVLEQNS